MRRRQPSLSLLSRSRAADLEPALGWHSALPWLMALGLIGSLGCSEAEAPDDSHSLAAARLAVAKVHQAYCTRFPQCQGVLAFADPQMCLQSPVMDAFARNLGDELPVFAAGMMAFHPEMVAPCIAAIGPPDCPFDKNWGAPPACAAIFTPLRKTGERCTGGGCQPEDYCKPSGNSGFCGTCEHTLRVGAGCNPAYNACEAGSRCVKGFCEPFYDTGAQGDACGPGMGGCAGPLQCLPVPGRAARRCAPPQGLGGLCESGGGCLGSAWCDRKQGVAFGICVAKATLGQPCRLSPYIGTDESSCAAGLACEPGADGAASATCQVVALGMRCSAEAACPSWGWTCVQGKDGEQRCAEPPGLGESCKPRPAATDGRDWRNQRCQLGLACDPQTQLCIAAPPIGAACVDLSCAAGLWCDVQGQSDPQGICRAAPKAAGDRCNVEFYYGLGGRCPYEFVCLEPGVCTALTCS